MSAELGNANLMWGTNSWAISNSNNSCGSEEMKGKNSTSDSFTLMNTLAPTPTPTTMPSTPVGYIEKSRNGVNKVGEGGNNGCGGSEEGESDHEIHILTERERRKKMRNMFSSLHNLLPHLASKVDKSTIVDEAISYIKTLEHTLREMQKQKLQKVRGVATSIENELSLPIPSMRPYSSTREAYLVEQVSSINLGMTTNSSDQHGIMPNFHNSFQTWSSPNVVLNICGEDAHLSIWAPKKLTLFTTIVYVLEKRGIDVVTAHISSNSFRNMYMIHAHAGAIPDHVQQMFPVEELFKLAVGEITFWISA